MTEPAVTPPAASAAIAAIATSIPLMCVDVTDDTRILDCTMVLHVLHDHNMLSLDDSSYSNILRIMV